MTEDERSKHVADTMEKFLKAYPDNIEGTRKALEDLDKIRFSILGAAYLRGSIGVGREA